MKVFETDSDIGSIRIYTDSMAMLLGNGLGDVPNKVIISESLDRQEQESALNEIDSIEKMVSTYFFEAKTKAYLSDYDCEENPIYEFRPGTYHVTLYPNATFLIQWNDPRR